MTKEQAFLISLLVASALDAILVKVSAMKEAEVNEAIAIEAARTVDLLEEMRST